MQLPLATFNAVAIALGSKRKVQEEVSCHLTTTLLAAHKQYHYSLKKSALLFWQAAPTQQLAAFVRRSGNPHLHSKNNLMTN